MIDTQVRVDNNNHQSYMTAEYIFRFVKVGETFTQTDLLNKVGFKNLASEKLVAKARSGIRIALERLTETSGGKSNVIVVTNDPTIETVYKLIDNERHICLEKSKSEGFKTINTKFFETQTSANSAFVLSPEILQKVDLLKIVKNIENPFPISKESILVDSSVASITNKIKTLTDTEKLQIVVNVCKMIDEARSDAVSVIELLNN